MEKNDSPKMSVICGVENCDYNKSMICHAKKIEVNAMGDRRAETCDGTCCSTFKNEIKG